MENSNGLSSMRNLLLVLLMMSQLSLLGQLTQIEGRILESGSNTPISFANISILNSDKGTFSNEKGYFKIKANSQDTLFISSIGFGSETIPAIKMTKVVYLVQDPIVLKEVIVENKSKIDVEVYGYHKWKRNGIWTNVRRTGMMFQNESNLNGTISIAYFRLNKRVYDKFRNQQRKNYKLKIQFFELTSEGKPTSIPINNFSKILDIDENQQKIRLNLKGENLTFPKTGCFMVLDFLGYVNPNENFVPFNNTITDIYHFAPVFSLDHQQASSWIWKGKDWMLLDAPIKNGYMNFNFGLEIEY